MQKSIKENLNLNNNSDNENYCEIKGKKEAVRASINQQDQIKDEKVRMEKITH